MSTHASIALGFGAWDWLTQRPSYIALPLEIGVVDNAVQFTHFISSVLNSLVGSLENFRLRFVSSYWLRMSFVRIYTVYVCNKACV